MVEDDSNFGAILKRKLEDFGFDVVHVTDGEAAIKTFNKKLYDIVLLDIVLPKKNGFEVAEVVRQKDDNIPVIFLTSKSLDEDKIKGFKTGGDDYITKPFSLQELLLRIDVWLKRSKKLNADKRAKFKFGKLTFDYAELSFLNANGEKITEVTQKEADLLKFLLENPNKTLTREVVLIHVWGKDDYFLGRSMDVFIAKIRRRIARIEGIQLVTLHGIGFKLIIPEK